MATNEERKSRNAKIQAELKKSSNKEKRSRNIFIASMAIIVLAIIGGAIYSVQTSKVDKAVDAVAPANLTKDLGIKITPEDVDATSQDSLKEVVIYEDFSCPFCKQFEDATSSYLSEQLNAGAISIEYRLVTFLDENGGSTNDYSERAASAAYCVRDAGGPKAYLEFHDYLYDNQPQEGGDGPSSKDLFNAAQDIEDKTSRECVLSDKYAPWTINADEAFSNNKEAQGTPAVFIDGEYVETGDVANALS